MKWQPQSEHCGRRLVVVQAEQSRTESAGLLGTFLLNMNTVRYDILLDEACYKSAKALCFGPMSPVTVWTDQVWQAGFSEKLGFTQVNDARSKALSDCKSGTRVGNRLFAAVLKQVKMI